MISAVQVVGTLLEDGEAADYVRGMLQQMPYTGRHWVGGKDRLRNLENPGPELEEMGFEQASSNYVAEKPGTETWDEVNEYASEDFYLKQLKIGPWLVLINLHVYGLNAKVTVEVYNQKLRRVTYWFYPMRLMDVPARIAAIERGLPGNIESRSWERGI